MRLLTALALIAVSGTAASRVGLDSDRYLEHIRFLASEELKGRGTGSPELEKAGRYLADQYKAMGLQPAFGKSYLQPFQVTTNAKLGSKNQFSDSLNKKKLRLEEDFVPFNFSSSGTITGEVVFAGYGITAKEYNYDDYAGLDVTGKTVLVLRYEPQEHDERSVFAGRVYTRHAQLDAKAINAKMHGAKAIILINNPVTHPNDREKLEKFGRTAGPSEAGIPYLQLKPEVVEPWLKAAGKDLKQIVEGIDQDLKPQSFPIPDSLKVDFEIDLVRESKTVHNVGAYLPGETDEYIVIGAHYDHLGLGEQFSMAPAMIGKPHYGADDNASGTAGTLELASYFKKGTKPQRGILFLNFTAEELGLLGSGYYVDHPSFPLEKCVAMLNLDMIGRMKEQTILVGGVGTGASFQSLIDRTASAHSDLKIDVSDQSGVGSSDHTSFTAKSVPVLFFFTGLHLDYHRPTDTWDRIETKGALQLLGFVSDVATSILNGAERPQFIKVADPNPHGGGTVSGSGYGPSFGSLPDMAFSGKGVRFTDVREGSPAQKAGFQAGDVMIEFDEKKIDNLYDFTYALRAKSPGDTVVVKVLRNGETVTKNVLLEARK